MSARDEPARGPLTTGHDALERCALFLALSNDDRRALLLEMEPVDFALGDTIVAQGADGTELYVVVTGRAQLARNAIALREVGPADYFGALGLVTGSRRVVTVRALTPMSTLRLTRERWQAFGAARPHVLATVLAHVVAHLRADLVEMTDDLRQVVGGRTVPRAREVQVRVGDELRSIATGTAVGALAPPQVNGDGPLVVAGLLDQKPVSLDTPIFSDAAVSFLTTDDWQGRQVYVRSTGLLLLESAHRVAPDIAVRLGRSFGAHQSVEVDAGPDVDRAELAARLTAEMERLIAARVRFRREAWPVEEAAAYFTLHGWQDAAELVRTRREATVPLVSCGELYALGTGPVLPDARALGGFALQPSGAQLVLDFGQRDPRRRANGQNGGGRDGGNGGHSVPNPETDMAHEHRAWLDAMGVRSVGAFNELCISGGVSQLVRVAEGFHERRIGLIADAIAKRRSELRVISIAGPSSSGKTTFIKRLRVQLMVSGVRTVGLSLDDYYVDREKTVRDARGEYDFEALEALDLPLLASQLRRLFAGESVRVARYDFPSGKSLPEGGPLLRLDDGLLLVEGIHGLHPALFGSTIERRAAYRVFIHPATTLPFDRLTRVSATDLRLIRRIVRDRRERGNTSAANIKRWPSVQDGEQRHIFPYQSEADAIFDSSLVYEAAVLKVYAERYLLEVPHTDPAYGTARHLRHVLDPFVAIYPDHVPPTSLLREFIGGSGFEF